MNDKFIVAEKNIETGNNLIKKVVLDGEHINKYVEKISIDSSDSKVMHILGNAKKAIRYFANPNIPGTRSKILALGKVQSGKTTFFTATIAYSFDNGYDLCIVLGGTKNNLLKQNTDRLVSEFENNKKIKIHTLEKNSLIRVIGDLSAGYKVILLVLKNVSSPESNLYEVLELAQYFGNIKTLIVDDEADEHTPGAPKLKEKNARAGITHDIIGKIMESFNNITMLFVTATPQANLLISTFDELSPDYIVLVEPGEGYTGGEAFHDTVNNSHVVSISDSDDFQSSIPESYKYAIKYFMLATSLKSLDESDTHYSMLVHPSSLTRVQNAIIEKINEDLDDLKNVLNDSKSLFFNIIKDEFNIIFDNEFNESKFAFEKVFEQLLRNLDQYRPFVLNTTFYGKLSQGELESSKSIRFKIFVGGNMLQRGVTINNLCVTYIFRDSKINAIDTLYQRARWFGYKKKYFDICKVFMTENLIEKFVACAENERDMWQSLREYLSSNIEIKYFPRLFTLDHDKLILTRKTVTNTVNIERVKGGYNYDTSLFFRDNDIEHNIDLYNDLVKNYKGIAYEKNFASGDYQKHLIITDKFTNLFDSFLSKYKFQRDSKLGPFTFAKLLNQVKDGIYVDELSIIVMRYKSGEYRSKKTQYELKQLPQGYDPGTEYSGDRELDGFVNKLHVQIHLVYVDKDNPDKIIPILALNNPLTRHTIRYVTGDNFYESL